MGCGCGCGCNGEGKNKKTKIITGIIFLVLIIVALVWKYTTGDSNSIENPINDSTSVEQSSETN